jgi:DNA modification methylase
MNTPCHIHNQDCVTGMREHLADASVDLTVTSIPFGALFSYSGKQDDIGNNRDGIDFRDSQFGLHMRFFIAELFRATKPGHNCCIHIQQLLRYKVQHGYMGRRDFRGNIIDMFAAEGWEWTGEVVIPKNPQVIAQRLNLHCLMFATGKKNGRNLAPAVNDYVLIFQRPGESEVPCPCLYDAEKNPTGWLSAEEWIRDAYGVWRWDDLALRNRQHHVPGLGRVFDENFRLEGFVECMEKALRSEWQASGIWSDILETDVLENWRGGRDEKDEKHVCPLQLEVIRRCVRLYSNPGELVLDPFMGIGSTAWVAREQGRAAVGFELKESYHALALKNMDRFDEYQREAELDLFAGMEGGEG